MMPTRWFIELWALQSLSNPIEAKATSQAADGSVFKQQSLIFTPSKSSQRLFPSQAYEIDNFGWISAAVLCFSLGIDKDINVYPRMRLYDNEAYIDLKSFTKG
jgi:hypothetical protein